VPRVTAPPLPESCPWGGWTPPNVDWCEEQLCSWVVNPADTWSNLAYILLGIWMLLATRRALARGHSMQPGTELFGPCAIVVGIFSFAYHASYTYFLQFFDFVGMFLFCFAVISAAALRLEWIAPRRALHFCVAGTIVFSALVPIVSETALPIQALVAGLIALILLQEALLWRRESDDSPVDRRLFWVAMALLGLAALASLADVTRSVCDPSNHILQGHSLWHLLSAASLYALYRFYAGLAPKSTRS
jgi:hypothetical protein